MKNLNDLHKGIQIINRQKNLDDSIDLIKAKNKSYIKYPLFVLLLTVIISVYLIVSFLKTGSTYVSVSYLEIHEHVINNGLFLFMIYSLVGSFMIQLSFIVINHIEIQKIKSCKILLDFGIYKIFQSGKFKAEIQYINSDDLMATLSDEEIEDYTELFQKYSCYLKKLNETTKDVKEIQAKKKMLKMAFKEAQERSREKRKLSE